MFDLASLREQVEQVLPGVTLLRRDIHRHPETAFEEHRTADLVRRRLDALGLEVRGVGETGVVGILRGAQQGPVVGLRADMDALPMAEETGVPYASEVPGKMHACGHDGHTACLLGVAEVLVGLREALPGTVKFLFQPAEERASGARVLVDAGVLSDPDVDVLFALHGWPGLAPGQIGLRPGPMLAAGATFRGVVRGRGGHGAPPALAVDPVLLAARIIENVQSIASRVVDPLDAVVVTVGSIHGGTASNIIPDLVTLDGTVRTLNETTRARVREAFHRIVSGVAAAHAGSAEIDYQDDLPVTWNDERVTAFLGELGAEILGPENVVDIPRPSMGGEDFSFYLQRVPGAMFRLGVGVDRAPLHSSAYDFNDDALRPGMLMLAAAVLRWGDTAGRA